MLSPFWFDVMQLEIKYPDTKVMPGIDLLDILFF